MHFDKLSFHRKHLEVFQIDMNQERNQDFRVFAWKRQCGEVQIVERTTSIKEAVRGFVENLAFECRE
ncbi:hypothetical protein CSX02_12625 [Agathobacter ruminis]|uniref:Uncharacterized protein n=1 Tax=Agathobacter ruminis TaxID=1712665 RepID=A0A2G3DZL4_9FIRM|nr:hypothetical protein CSX02_12625 [Agathobacter ruminis]